MLRLQFLFTLPGSEQSDLQEDLMGRTIEHTLFCQLEGRWGVTVPVFHTGDLRDTVRGCHHFAFAHGKQGVPFLILTDCHLSVLKPFVCLLFIQSL